MFADTPSLTFLILLLLVVVVDSIAARSAGTRECLSGTSNATVMLSTMHGEVAAERYVDVHAALVTDAGARAAQAVGTQGNATVNARFRTLSQAVVPTRAAANVAYVPKNKGVRLRTQPASDIGDTLGEHTVKWDKRPGALPLFLGRQPNDPDPDVCGSAPSTMCCPGVRPACGRLRNCAKAGRGGGGGAKHCRELNARVHGCLRQCVQGKPGSHGQRDEFVVRGA